MRLHENMNQNSNKLLRKVKMETWIALSVMSLKCWDCIWDSRTPESREFCKDPFDASNISDAQRNWSYRNCTIAPERALNHTVHCRKVTRKGKNSFSLETFWTFIKVEISCECFQLELLYPWVWYTTSYIINYFDIFSDPFQNTTQP